VTEDLLLYPLSYEPTVGLGGTRTRIFRFVVDVSLICASLRFREARSVEDELMAPSTV